MEWDTLQLMVYGEDLASVDVISENDGLVILGVNTVENSSYLFVDVAVSENIEAGNYNLIFVRDGAETEF